MQLNRLNQPRVAGASRAPVVGRRALQVQAIADKAQLAGAYNELKEYIQSKHSNPIIVRLAWHDSGTYDKNIKEWPQRGGAIGSIRFVPEINHAANAGLKIAINLLKPIQKKYPDVTWADLFQMASAAAVEAAGGPKIPMQYGRRDARSEADCAKEGNLPGAAHPFADGSLTPAEHLRKIFYRMGFNDQEIVVLSGGHTLGRSRPDRSGHGKASTKYTEKGPGTPGGQSWTSDWLVFNNSYFREIRDKRDADLLVLETDACIFEDPGFKPYAEKYADDEQAFFADYALAHKKLSELGVEWEAGGPITI